MMRSTEPSQQPPAADARKLRLLMVVGTCAAILLLILGAEAAVRFRQYYKYGSTATLEERFTVDPGSALRVPIAGLARGRISVNRLGFRGNEITVPKPSNTLRVAFLGASTTWCAEVSGNQYVWAHQVTDELRRALPQVDVDYVNAGVPGYTMASVLKSFQMRVAPLDPDIVVIYEASNDLSGEMRRLAVRQGIIDTDAFQDLSWPSNYSLLWHLVEKNLKLLAAERLAQSPSSTLKIDPTMLGAEYRKALTQVVREAQRNSKLVAIATFSIQPRHDQSSQRKLQASSSALYYMPFLHPDTIISGFARYNEVAREVARETGAFLIDGEGEIPGDPLHFHDSVHFTDAGSTAMAKRVSHALATNQVVREISLGR